MMAVCPSWGDTIASTSSWEEKGLSTSAQSGTYITVSEGRRNMLGLKYHNIVSLTRFSIFLE